MQFRARALRGAVAAVMLLLAGACGDDDNDHDDNRRDAGTLPPDGVVPDGGINALCFQRTALASDLADQAPLLDPDLVNSWGVIPGLGAFWIANAGSGLITVHDATGARSRVGENLNLQLGEGITGLVLNESDTFRIEGPSGPVPATLIIASEEGRLLAVNPDVSRESGVTVVDQASTQAVFKGVAILNTPDGMRLLATDFRNAQVDVFDDSFAPVSDLAFVTPGLPEGFAPFNVAVIDDAVYVTYAQRDEEGEDDVPGAGLGAVSKFDNAGALQWTLRSQDLNAPWGMALAPATAPLAGVLLVGNFGDGRITAVDPANGRELGQVTGADGTALAVDGLWGLAFGDAVEEADPNALYFAAGPNDEENGLFGVIASTPCAQ